ncbi:hypothetical protein Q9Q99_16950 [Curtobacterium flaccumfaciens]|nr:hypothetical protein Q9Q99_16950 [Curtobacterium flaccumfaciens]
MVSRWSKGRIALLGDAAWGSGPTGMGTTLSLVGAHILAGELARTVEPAVGADHGYSIPDAFSRYEEMLRGYADSAQGLPRAVRACCTRRRRRASARCGRRSGWRLSVRSAASPRSTC